MGKETKKPTDSQTHTSRNQCAFEGASECDDWMERSWRRVRLKLFQAYSSHVACCG